MEKIVLKTPVVLIIFKRPETTRKVFESIREARPSKLFVIADGPRIDRPGEAERCVEAREIIHQVDWDCEVFKEYTDVNLGCGKRVFSGLDWVFKQVDDAIILEDDCIPHPTFFPFCDELLERYRNDERISSISAQRFYEVHSTQSSYYFSRYPHCWGWATWKRAWQHYDFSLKCWEEVKEKSLLQDILLDSNSVKRWEEILQSVYEGEIDTWDYQWTLSCWLQNSFSIHPCANLVKNIGFGADATHTVGNSKFESLSVKAMQFPLQHPLFMIRDVQSDAYIQKQIFDVSQMQKLKNKLRRTVRNIFPGVDREIFT
jgi:hypothetical protein